MIQLRLIELSSPALDLEGVEVPGMLAEEWVVSLMALLQSKGLSFQGKIHSSKNFLAPSVALLVPVLCV